MADTPVPAAEVPYCRIVQTLWRTAHPNDAPGADPRLADAVRVTNDDASQITESPDLEDVADVTEAPNELTDLDRFEMGMGAVIRASVTVNDVTVKTVSAH